MQRIQALRFLPATGLPSLRRLMRLIRLWQQQARTRRQLAALDDRQLSDIGISLSEREDELSKPFWR